MSIKRGRPVEDDEVIIDANNFELLCPSRIRAYEQLTKLSKKQQFARHLKTGTTQEWKSKMERNLKIAIYYYYCHTEQFEESSPEMIHRIMKIYSLENDHNRNNYRKVQRILLEINNCQEKEVLYSEHLTCPTRGRKPIIQDYTDDAKVIYDAFQAGLSTAVATVILNQHRSMFDPPKPRVSKSTVNTFVNNSEVALRQHRQTKKSGKDDEDTPWAKARVEQCNQFLIQYEMPVEELVVDHPTWPKLYLDGVVFWDEHHRQVILGHSSREETRISRNELGEPCSVKNGGVFPPRRPRTTVKYPGDARGCFGVAVRRKGVELQGIKCKPFNYTGKKVCSISTFDGAVEKELARVKNQRGQWGKQGKGYPERFGDEFMIHAKNNVGKKLCSIKDIIDHVITESTAVYADTDKADTFLIYHDALSLWWSKEAQQYIESQGFGSRQLKCLTPTNDGGRYANKLVGDSPELCRGLDSHGFADLKRSTMVHLALSSKYAKDDVRKFKMGTPQEVWSTLQRCWTLEPTSERIVEDIMKLPDILRKIIECNGCVVQDLNFRTGRRYRRADDSGYCKTKPRSSSRKSTLTLPPIHTDCIEALTLLSGFDRTVTHNPSNQELEVNVEARSVESSDSSDSDETENTLQPEDSDDGSQHEETMISCTSVAFV
jgi:hypothetical protein